MTTMNLERLPLPTPTRPFPTGFTKLDELMGWLHPGEVTVVAGLTGVGKSSLAQNIAVGAAQNLVVAPSDQGEPYEALGAQVFFCSLESTHEALWGRFLCAEAGVDLKSFRHGQLTEHDGLKLKQAEGFLSRLPLHLETGFFPSAESIAREVRSVMERGREEDRERAGLLVVDYLQLLPGNPQANTRDQQIAESMRAFKFLAKELQIHVLLVSQLNRNPDRDKVTRRLLLSDLRDSGAIGHDADNVLFVCLDTAGELTTSRVWIAFLDLAKHRNGPCGRALVQFNPRSCCFMNLEPGDVPEDEFGQGRDVG